MNLSILFILIASLLIDFTETTQCQTCDSFQGYCDFDGTTCVGPKCSRRTAPTPSGLIREQRLCVPSDSPTGCRKTVLWDEIEGMECVCEGHLCNTSNFATLTFSTVIVLVFLY